MTVRRGGLALALMLVAGAAIAALFAGRAARRRGCRQPPGGAADLARPRSGHQRLLPLPQLRARQGRPGRADHERQSRRGAEPGPNYYAFDERHLLDRDRQRPRRQGGRRPLRRAVRERDPRLHEGPRPSAALHRRWTAAVVTTWTTGQRPAADVPGDDERQEAPPGLAPVLPDNVGPRTTNYEANFLSEGVRTLDGGIRVFAGPRDDPFYIDLGAPSTRSTSTRSCGAPASTCSPGTTSTRSRSRCRWR